MARTIKWNQTQRCEPLIQVSTVRDLTFVPVGLPALARVSLFGKSFRAVKAYIRWNPVSNGFGGKSGGFGVRRFW
jgi:hypothetical protein